MLVVRSTRSCSRARCRGKERAFWSERYDDINALEHHLARNGTVVLKFFLHVSKKEQSNGS